MSKLTIQLDTEVQEWDDLDNDDMWQVEKVLCELASDHNVSFWIERDDGTMRNRTVAVLPGQGEPDEHDG